MKKKTSQITTALNTRILTNNKFGNKDLDQWIIERLDIKQGENILDVCCGTGNHLMKFAAIAKAKCIGIDISDTSIKQAREKNKDENVEFVIGDIDNMDDGKIVDDYFDIITAIYALYYSKNPTKLLETLKNKIKAGGKIVAVGPYSDNNKGWFDFLNQFMKLPENIMKTTTTFMEDEVLPFGKKNFKSVQTHEFVNDIAIPTIDDLRNYWKSNIYHKEEYDANFEKYAKKHFEKHKSFDFFKKALMIIMED